MHRYARCAAWGLLAAVSIMPAHADVKSSSANGFEVVSTATVKATPEKVYATLLEPGYWWNPEHSYSGAAANLTIEPRIGGCFCEKLPNGGGVQHMTVAFLAPGKTIGLSGALGPLAGEGVAGMLFWSLKPAPDGGTIIEQKYTVGGYLHGDGMTWAKVVDGVLSTQLARAAHYLDTGSPDAPK